MRAKGSVGYLKKFVTNCDHFDIAGLFLVVGFVRCGGFQYSIGREWQLDAPIHHARSARHERRLLAVDHCLNNLTVVVRNAADDKLPIHLSNRRNHRCGWEVIDWVEQFWPGDFLNFCDPRFVARQRKFFSVLVSVVDQIFRCCADNFGVPPDTEVVVDENGHTARDGRNPGANSAIDQRPSIAILFWAVDYHVSKVSFGIAMDINVTDLNEWRRPIAVTGRKRQSIDCDPAGLSTSVVHASIERFRINGRDVQVDVLMVIEGGPVDSVGRVMNSQVFYPHRGTVWAKRIMRAPNGKVSDPVWMSRVWASPVDTFDRLQHLLTIDRTVRLAIAVGCDNHSVKAFRMCFVVFKSPQRNRSYINDPLAPIGLSN